ncbi:sigma-70 family RNA polymerase sigma factor [Paenibacillus nasutitermitis]|uniref:RNA polymerase sigma factor n=1 Tax=Paenibacillus nasutitermitis TaxID=1652958 RepID=A0A917DM23_9BACL|nr:sigma-70 family RNA polymerase sigma factor [Paenibacillus nasutitermitis]GGD51486.1 DNA-directed RNA polymerase sigma-70 factor [Paenibacillus nasutitermitis]
MAARDEAALQEIMQQYGDYLLRTAYLILNDRQTAEEVVQDTFIQAFNKIGQLREADKMKAWLLRITVNRCRMKQRLWNWRRFLPLGQTEQLHGDETAPGPEELLLLEWRNEQLSKAVHRLSYKYREVVTLYYYNEMSVKDISLQLQTNENTIKARLARGRIQLNQILGKERTADETGTTFI